MDINKIFYTQLFDQELYSFEDHGGEYSLKISNYVSEKSLANSSEIDNHKYVFSEALIENLSLIYNQVRKISLSWGISEEVSDELMDKNKWLKKYRIENELNHSFIREQLSGVINVVTLEEMFNQKKYGYLTIDGIRYLPFDHHYGLIACFKKEVDTVRDNIFIFNTEDSDKILDMKIGCLKYLELAYEAKLIYYWQYAYLFKDSAHNERLNTMLPIIFPFLELDLSNFK